jgi:hypothetical protein
MRGRSRALVRAVHLNVRLAIPKPMVPVLADYGPSGLAFLLSLPLAFLISAGLCIGGIVVLRSSSAKEQKGLGWKLIASGLASLLIIPYSVFVVARLVSH